MLWWAIYDGQRFSGDLGYAPLPEAIAKKGAEKVLAVNVNSP